MASQTEAARTGRIGTIDFWRGIVLVAILCDHIPGNLWEKATPRNFALSDSAEAFVFLSGVSVALAYYKRAERSEWRELFARCFSRALRIYGVHILLTALAIVVFALAFGVSGEPRLLFGDGREYAFEQPGRTALGVAILSEQLGYFNILPMYVLFMLWAPAALALARRSVVWPLALSLATYAAARYFNVAPPTWPERGVWFFNPLTWQLIFTLGVVCGIVFRERRIPFSSWAYGASWVVLAVAAVLVTDGFGTAPGLRDLTIGKLDIDKSQLGLVRLSYFAVLCYALGQTSVARVEKTALGVELERLGRHSLAVFAFGSIFAYAGQAAMKVLSVNYPGLAPAGGLIYTMAGIAGMFVFARWLEGLRLWDFWLKREDGPQPELSPAPLSLPQSASPRQRPRLRRP